MKETIKKIIDSLKNRNEDDVLKAIQQTENNIREEHITFLQNTTPKHFWDADIKSIDYRIAAFMKNDKKFCWIYGEYGNGKTYSIYAIRNYLIMQNNIYFEIIMEGEINYETNFKRISAVDNIGISEGKFKFLSDYYFNLFDYCWRSEKKLYLTSTLNPDKWLDKLRVVNPENAAAIASRLSNVTDIIELIGDDRRKNILK
jgi:chromosomal replication initiation ATPase DnaA